MQEENLTQKQKFMNYDEIPSLVRMIPYSFILTHTQHSFMTKFPVSSGKPVTLRTVIYFLFAFCSIWFSPVFAEERTPSPGNKTYVISPNKGNDESSGTAQSPWKTFAPLNKLILAPGDRVEITSAGNLTESLSLSGGGTDKKPVIVKFAPGKYDWMPDKLLRRKLQISNTNDASTEDKAIAMDMENVKNLRIEGTGALFLCRGKMMTVHLKNSRNVVLSGIGFDYKRPTLSEYTAEEVHDKNAIISIHKDSDYALENGKVVWIGEGWKMNAGGYGQTYKRNPETLVRSGSPLGGIDKAEEISPGKLKVTYSNNPGFEKGVTYQNRDTRRDYCGVFCNRSENIFWINVKFHYMHGMGVINQFTKNISFKNLEFGPSKGSGRTCAAWADMLHFSGCGGKIIVDGTHFNGANDDAINIHGTYLRIVDVPSPKEVKVRFIHPQTFGFEAFVTGDQIEFVSHETLLPYGKARVKEAKLINEREMMLTLDSPVPGERKENDVIENITWTPSVHVKNCIVDAIPTRGFLLSTRKPILIENCIFNRTGMSAILVAADANSWFESGAVKNLTLRNNRFIECGEPVINFHPENGKRDEKSPMHSGINITNNIFELKGKQAISLKSTGNVKITGNTFINSKGNKNATLQDIITRDASPAYSAEKNTVKSVK